MICSKNVVNTVINKFYHRKVEMETQSIMKRF